MIYGNFADLISEQKSSHSPGLLSFAKFNLELVPIKTWLATELGAQYPSSQRFPGKISSRPLWMWQSLSFFFHSCRSITPKTAWVVHVHAEPRAIYQGTCWFNLCFRLPLLLGQGSKILRNKVGNLGRMTLVTAVCLKIAYRRASWKKGNSAGSMYIL